MKRASRRNARGSYRRPRKNNSSSLYNSSSVAYNYIQDNDHRYNTSRRSNGAKKKNGRRRRKLAQKVKEQTGHSLKLYFAATIIFVFGLIFVLLHANLLDQRATISELRDNLKEIEQNNDYIQAELTKSIDRKELERVASEKLGMQKPSSYQVVYIDVPKQSYTVMHDAKTDNSNSDNLIQQLFQKLVQYVKNFFNIK